MGQNRWCKSAATGLAAIVALTIIPLAAYNFWIFILTKDTSATVRPAARTVLNAYHLSQVTGAYWENDLEDQAKIVALSSQAERLEFYRVILLNCKMETTKWMVFSKSVKPDAIPLRNDLITRMRAGEFSDHIKKMRANTWILMLKDIEEVGQ